MRLLAEISRYEMARVFQTNKNIWEITFFYFLEMTYEILQMQIKQK